MANRLIVSQRSSLALAWSTYPWIRSRTSGEAASSSADAAFRFCPLPQPSMASGSRVISAVTYFRPSPCTTTWLM